MVSILSSPRTTIIWQHYLYRRVVVVLIITTWCFGILQTIPANAASFTSLPRHHNHFRRYHQEPQQGQRQRTVSPEIRFNKKNGVFTTTHSSRSTHYQKKNTHLSLSETALTTPNNNDSSSPFVKFIHPPTQCEVTLLGVLHGSSSSLSDVTSLLSTSPPSSVVVLELCTSRYTDIRRKDDEGDYSSSSPPSSFLESLLLSSSTSQGRRSLPTLIPTLLLSLTSGIQTALSGFEPGSEFKTALELSRQRANTVVLADRNVDETVRRLGRVPSIGWDILFSKDDDGDDDDDDDDDDCCRGVAKEWRNLQFSIFGNGDGRSVDMGRVLMRSEGVRGDLLRLIIFPLGLVGVLFVGAAALLGDSSSSGQSSTALSWAIISDPSLSMRSLWDGTVPFVSYVTEILSSVSLLTMFFLFLVVPVCRVIITERDDCLARGVEAACAMAAEDDRNKDGGKVVAVMGLLHVNGVARRLLKAD